MSAFSHAPSMEGAKTFTSRWMGAPAGVVLDQLTRSLGLGLSIPKMKNRARWSLGISLNPKPLWGTDGGGHAHSGDHPSWQLIQARSRGACPLPAEWSWVVPQGTRTSFSTLARSREISSEPKSGPGTRRTRTKDFQL